MHGTVQGTQYKSMNTLCHASPSQLCVGHKCEKVLESVAGGESSQRHMLRGEVHTCKRRSVSHES